MRHNTSFTAFVTLLVYAPEKVMQEATGTHDSLDQKNFQLASHDEAAKNELLGSG
jgi:hypothetical protein